jgi:chemotaxis protein methyltransferase CheR
MAVRLTDDEFLLFSEFLVAEVGIRFGPERREILRARLEPLRAELGLPTFERLLFQARYHPGRADVMGRMLSALTNNESYFFREAAQLDLLRDEVLPYVGRDARSEARPVRILSAGCAAGEEVYTLAIVARSVLGGLRGRVEIVGMDVDESALMRAREGFYRNHSLRGVEPDRRREHFIEQDGGWRIRPALQAAARFRHGNLVDPAWVSELEGQDVVFCRNVLIYFDEAGIRRAVDHLYQVVRPGGYLFLGHAESLSRVPTRFVPERRAGAVYYRRPGG